MSFFDEPDLEGEDELEPPLAPSQYHSQESELLLERLRDLIDAAPNVPLSSTPRVSREEVLDLLDDALVRLPEELRAARWLLKEREEFLSRMRHEGDEIIAQARERAERMVQRTEVVKAAEQRAYQILDTAEAEARRLRHEVEDFCDQKLASFEIILERTHKMVTAGRAKLQGTNLTADLPAEAVEGFDTGEHRPLEPVDDHLDVLGEHPDLSHLPPPPPPSELFDDDHGG